MKRNWPERFRMKNSPIKYQKLDDSPEEKVDRCFGVYDVKGNNRQFGSGLCCIIANSTGDLKGYKEDMQNIANLHKNTLHGKVFKEKFPWEGQSYPMENLTKDQFMKLLRAIQSYLNAKGYIDRLFLYILSHGDEHGIKMCEKGDDSLEDKVQMTDIVNMFTHDKVPSMKSFPKVIVNQSCKGDGILQAAGPPLSPTSCDSSKPRASKIAIGSDVIVCDASSNNGIAWVSESGSIFIKTLIQVMTQHHEDEHFYDILTEVNRQVSKQRLKTHGENKEIVETYQMPCIHSQLTKKFFLALKKK